MITYDILISLSVETASKHGLHEQVDDKGDKQRNGCLYEEVEVGFLYLRPLGSIHFSRLQTNKSLKI